MNTNRLLIRSWIFLLGICLGGQVLGQERIVFKEQGGTKNIILDIKSYVLYKPYISNTPKEIASNKIVPIVDPGDAKIRLVFEPGPQQNIPRKDFSFAVITDGDISVSSPKNTYTVKIGANRNYIDFNIGSIPAKDGTITIAPREFDSRPISVSYPPAPLDFKIFVFKEEYERRSFRNSGKVRGSDLASDRAKLKALAELYDAFIAFTSPDFKNVKGADYVFGSLTDIKKQLDNFHREYESRTGFDIEKLEAVKEYYAVYAKQEPNSLQSPRKNAEALLSQLDDRIWTVCNKSDPAQLENYLSNLKVEIPNELTYFPSHQKEAKESLEDAINSLLAGSNSCDTYQLTLDKLETLQYYKTNQNDPRFVSLRAKIAECNKEDEGPDCTGMYNEAVRVRSRRACIDFLNSCPDAPRNQQNRIQQILREIAACDACRGNYREISERTDNLPEYAPLISRVLEDENCACLSQSQIQQLKTWKKMVAPLAFRQLGEPMEGEKPGDKVFSFLFTSGGEIELFSLDGEVEFAELTSGLQEQVIHEWVYPDSLLKVIVTDGRIHRLVFKALSGDTLGTPLILDKMQVMDFDIVPKEYVAIQVKNGVEPFTMQLIQGSSISLIPLKGVIDTVRISDLLGRGLNGEYSIEVRDFLNRKVQIEGQKLLIDQPFQARLWMFLLLPLILITVFLIYRNIDVTRS